MKPIFIAVGSNEGNRPELIKRAAELLKNNPAIQIVRSSCHYETDPVGGPPQGKFLNAVWKIETSLTARELLNAMLKVEQALGRERTVKNGPRTIDLDILFYGDQIIDEDGLNVPHPRLRERWFVLKPLWDLAADFIDPVTKKSVCELLDECRAYH